MAEEKKNFYPFKINHKKSRKREDIEKLKASFPFADILGMLGVDCDEDADEDAIQSIAINLRNIAQNEYNALYDLMEKRVVRLEKERYSAERKDNAGDIKVVSDFFSAQNEYGEKQRKDYEAFCELMNKHVPYDPDDSANDDERAKKENELLEQHPELKEAVNARENYEKELSRLKSFWVACDHLSKNEKVNKSLVSFYNKCRKEQKEKEFNDVYHDFIIYDINDYPVSENEDGKIVNEHRFDLTKDGKVSRSICNLDGTGLDISWVGNEFGIARSYDKLSREQLEALAKYCHYKGIDVSDFLTFGSLPVYDGEEKIGSCADIFREELDKLDPELKKKREEKEEVTGLSEEEKKKINAYSKDKYEEFSSDLGQVDVKNYSPHNYLKDPNLDVRKSVMVNSAEIRSALMGNCDPALTSFKRGWNTTTISVYANENDKLVDGDIDKNGKRTRTKRFAVELTASNPPSARIYMGTDKEFSADHARLILDGFKKCGCKYFIVPPADQIGGKKAMGAWLKACVKAKMIPLCKTSEKSEGMVLGAADLHGLKEAFDEEVKSGGITGDAKIEFMLRISQQLERQEAYLSSKNPKYQTDSAVAAKMEYFKKGAMFEKLQAAHLGDIKKFIENGVRQEGWDVADKAAAVKALGYILMDMNEGKLNGKSFNPLSKDQWKDIRESMAYYMTREKPLIVENIENIVSLSEKDTQAKVDTAARKVYSNAEAFLNDVCANIAESGIEIKVNITKDINSYQQSTYEGGEDKLYAIRFPEPKRDEKTGAIKEGEVDYRAISERAKAIDKRKRVSRGPRTGITGRDNDDRR